MSFLYEKDIVIEDEIETPSELDEISADNLPLKFVKQYLRVDHNLDDLEISIYIRSAISYVRNYIKQPAGEKMDDEMIMPVLILVAYFYENKSPQMKSNEKLDITFSNILNIHRREVL